MQIWIEGKEVGFNDLDLSLRFIQSGIDDRSNEQGKIWVFSVKAPKCLCQNWAQHSSGVVEEIIVKNVNSKQILSNKNSNQQWIKCADKRFIVVRRVAYIHCEVLWYFIDSLSMFTSCYSDQQQVTTGNSKSTVKYDVGWWRSRSGRVWVVESRKIPFSLALGLYL